MRSAVEIVTEAAAGEGLAVVKAIPRSPDHLGVELRGPDGGLVAGQWFRDRDQARSVSAQTRRAAPGSGVRLLTGGLLLQPGGADRKLSGVRRLTESDGATVVAHRPEKRAVVRLAPPGGETTYVKVVRPRRLEATLRGAQVTGTGIATPQVRAVDDELAAVTFDALPGRTLFDLLGDPTVTEDRIEKVGNAVGEAVRRLHSTVVTADLPTHDAAAELAVARRWAGLAADHGLLGAHLDTVHGLLASAEADLAAAPGPPVLLHRDLHDKQLLIDGVAVGMLDFDLAALGDPALDLANLLTHLELRARQERCSADRAHRCAAAVRAGYGPVPQSWQRRIAGYELATRVRLACVYAFRPAHAQAAAQLVPATAV
ncbi:phosphotransferase family protein [Ruania zhangjianzhongii]|uniref:phosphotransferase family protein n=1 Tax=Ruania zhangjianzhongii TaxID=2603206 RepID=UPI0011C6FF2A|nr:phosphotransferase [Ruania zhangjianzhongii]